MRGTVLLMHSGASPGPDVDGWRANGLTVLQCHELADALKQMQNVEPDVIVVVVGPGGSRPIVPTLRRLVDDATSIIVTGAAEERDVAREAGADSFVLTSAPPGDLVYEIHRALILVRSGRRLPWNG
jgi:DNA-binding NarL/FixJ family response regulator